RRLWPEQRRPFKVPFYPWTPLLALVSSLYLMLNLPTVTWVRFGVWLAIGLVIYFAYGRRASRLAKERPGGQVVAFLPEPAAKPLPAGAESRKKRREERDDQPADARSPHGQDRT
ncbi:MAG: amino acid permease C-terminal domain-containing protein, partial [Desulfotomaculales bacterium]